MSRGRAAAAGIAVVALLAILFFAAFELVEEEVDRPFGPEARANPLLAAERLSERLGVPARSLVRLDETPPTGEVVVFADARRLRTQSETKRMLEWIGRGGRAIVVVPSAADEETEDPLLAALGVAVVTTEGRPFGYLRFVHPDDPEPMFLRRFGDLRLLPPEEAEWIEADVLQPRRDENATGEEARKVEELLDRLRREREPTDRPERPPPAPPTPTPDDDGIASTPLARIPLGDGWVVVLTDGDFLENGRIGDLDHARAAWRLISWGGKPTGVVFVHGSAEPRLFSMLAAATWPGLVGSAFLLAALAWRAGKRFGPAEREPALERRRLMEHVEATGRFHWRRGNVETLLGGTRRAIAERLHRRRPHLADASLERRVAALAELAGHSPAEVEHALTPGAPGGPETFTRAVRTLEAIRRNL